MMKLLPLLMANSLNSDSSPRATSSGSRHHASPVCSNRAESILDSLISVSPKRQSILCLAGRKTLIPRLPKRAVHEKPHSLAVVDQRQIYGGCLSSTLVSLQGAKHSWAMTYHLSALSLNLFSPLGPASSISLPLRSSRRDESARCRSACSLLAINGYTVCKAERVDLRLIVHRGGESPHSGFKLSRDRSIGQSSG